MTDILFYIIFMAVLIFLFWIRAMFRYKKNNPSIIEKRYDDFLDSNLGEKYERLDFDEEYDEMIKSVMSIDDEEDRNKVLETLVDNRYSNKKNKSKAIG